MVTSDWRLSRRWQVHCAGRYVDPVTYYGIPAYSELDARVGYQLNEHLEFSLVGRNLLDAQHPEYDSALSRRLTELQRSVNLICLWRY
jgi:iron complex outermembrane receptor protein